MAYGGSISSSKLCTNDVLDYTHGNHALAYEREKYDYDLLAQTVRELQRKYRIMDKNLSKLDMETQCLKTKLGENSENGAVKMVPNDEALSNIATTAQSADGLLKPKKDLQKAVSLSNDPEDIQKPIKHSMALEGSMSPNNKGCTNSMLDCTSGKHVLSYEIKDQDCRSMEQTVQELKLKIENKDKRILELENEIHHIRIKFRENRENGDMKMLPNEAVSNIATTAQSVESLMEANKDLKKALSLSKDSEAIQKLIKENEEYKKKLRMQRYSDVPERSQSQMQISELQHDIQKLAHHCQAMYHRLTNTENIKSIPVSSMQNYDLLAAENEKLRSKLAEVTEMNKKWQMYNQQREVYVKKLSSALGTGVTQSRSQEVKTNQNSNIANIQKDTSKLEEENLALKAQIKIFTEDFESERQDREKAQARVNDLEEQLIKLKENQHHDKNSTGSELGYSRSLGKFDYQGQQKVFSPQFTRMQKHHGLVTDGCSETLAPRSPSSPTKKLTCPSCMKLFEKQSELLEHVDICF